MSNAAPTLIIDRSGSEPEPTPKPGPRFSLPLALIVAGGVAAGIGLARPPASDDGSRPTETETAPTTAANPQRGGYLSGRSGGDDDTAQPSAPGAPAPAAVTIRGFAFGGSALVAAGQPVTVANADGATHTLTADGGEFDTGTIAGGDSGGFTAPATPGTYTYFCAIHPSMEGSITVQ